MYGWALHQQHRRSIYSDKTYDREDTWLNRRLAQATAQVAEDLSRSARACTRQPRRAFFDKLLV